LLANDGIIEFIADILIVFIADGFIAIVAFIPPFIGEGLAPTPLGCCV
jgi:hypothetical protein